MELAGRRADGTHFPAEISLSAIDTGDQVMVSAAIRDVTDRKRAEANSGACSKRPRTPSSGSPRTDVWFW